MTDADREFEHRFTHPLGNWGEQAKSPVQEFEDMIRRDYVRREDVSPLIDALLRVAFHCDNSAIVKDTSLAALRHAKETGILP